MFPELRGRVVALDTETTGLNTHSDHAFGVSLAFQNGDRFYFDRRQEGWFMWEWLRHNLRHAALVVGHNLKFDLHMLARENVPPPPRIFDTMVALALLDEHRRTYNLDDAAWDYLKQRKVAMEHKGTMVDMPIETVAPYAMKDAELTLALWEKFRHMLADQDLLDVMRVEMDLQKVLLHMEQGGVRVDVAAAEAAIPKLTEVIDALQAQLPEGLNINSPLQMRELFKPVQVSPVQFQLADGTLCPATDKGAPSITADVLRDMVDPMAITILKLRKSLKTRDTFLRRHVLGHATPEGYVHATFNQTRTDSGGGRQGTGSGRLSATEPALQQINKRDKENAAIVRSLFLPDEGQKWLCMDHAQIDFRTATHLMRDPGMLNAYAAYPEMDYHQIVSDMTGIPRNPEYAGGPNTKMLNLMLAFGSSAGTAAHHMGMKCTLGVRKDGRAFYAPGFEAEQMFEQYHERLPAVKRFLKHATHIADTRKYVRTALRRRIRFPRGVATYKAGAMLFQGWAADVHKCGLIACHEVLRGTSSRLMVSVHDEIGVSLDPSDESNGIVKELNRAYCAAGSDSDFPNPEFRLRVPIRASASIDVNWHEASK
jgi:DNA polymerase I